MANHRFVHRRELVVQEATAIGTTFLRSELLDPKNGEAIRDLLKRYVDVRLDFFNAGEDQARIEKEEANALELHHKLWDQTIQFTQSERGPLAATFVSSLNEVIDLQAEREDALHNVIPNVIYGMILIIASLGLGSLGFSRGVQDKTGYWNILLLVFLFTSVVTLIHDLDRPRAGAITEGQESLLALKNLLNHGK
jgi:hypothetical protein